jgi:hypothetical protein
MTGVRLWDAPSARADIRAGLLSAKIARKRKGKYFRTGKAEPRVYRRGWRPGAQSLWIRGLYGDRQTLTPHERWPLDGNLEFLLLQHPNAPSGRLPHRPLLLFGVQIDLKSVRKNCYASHKVKVP